MLIDDIFELLGGSANPNNGITYGLSATNSFDELLSTPNLWGRNPAVNDYDPAATNLTRAIQTLVASAEHSVDIATLTPLPDDLFLAALRDGIQQAAQAGRNVVVRVLAGVYHPFPMNDLLAFLEKLQAPKAVPVYVGAMMSDWVSWNHAKLIIVDGKHAIAGGHNMWTSTYCRFAPMHDVSVRISGPAVTVAQNFLNAQWTRIATYSRTPDATKWYWSRLKYGGEIYPNALPRIQSAVPAGTGSTRVLSLARMGSNLMEPSPSANASRTARIAAARRAKSHIRFSQQMLGATLSPVDPELINAFGQHVADRKELSIIISDTGASNGSGAPYSGYGVTDTAKLLAAVVGRITGLRGPALAQHMARYVHVGPIRIYDRQPGDPGAQSWKWRKGSTAIEPGNHAKVYIIDEEAFYVGSDNAYSILLNAHGLQEFGFLISGADETRRFISEYWDKAWTYSSQFQFRDWNTLGDAAEEGLA